MSLLRRQSLEEDHDTNGGREWTPADVSVPAAQRLYRAVVSELSLVDRHAVRTPVQV